MKINMSLDLDDLVYTEDSVAMVINDLIASELRLQLKKLVKASVEDNKSHLSKYVQILIKDKLAEDLKKLTRDK